MPEPTNVPFNAPPVPHARRGIDGPIVATGETADVTGMVPKVPIAPVEPVVQPASQSPYFLMPGPFALPVELTRPLPPLPNLTPTKPEEPAVAPVVTVAPPTQRPVIRLPEAAPGQEVLADPATTLRSAQDDVRGGRSAQDDGVGVAQDDGVGAAQGAAAVAPESAVQPVVVPWPPKPPVEAPDHTFELPVEQVTADPATTLRSAQDDVKGGRSAQDDAVTAAQDDAVTVAQDDVTVPVAQDDVTVPVAPIQPAPSHADEHSAFFADDAAPAPRIGAMITAERDEPPTKKRSILAFVVVGLMIVSLVLMFIVLLHMNILSPRLLVTTVGLDAALIACLALLLLTSRIAARQTRYVVGLMVSVLLIIANSIVAWVGHGYNQMVNNIQAPTVDTIQYDVVGMTSGPASLSAIANSPMGWDGTDVNQAAVKSQVTSLVTGVTLVSEADWSTAVNNMINGQYPSVVIQDAYMQIFSDADPGDYANVKILSTFEITGTAETPGGTFTPMPPSGADQPFIVYISGIDTSGAIANRARSDVNQLMVVNPKTGKVLLVNTPRDFYVTLADMPNCNLKDKLTHSGVYGIGVSVDTMNALYGININYYVRLNFSSLVTLVDALGGIDVNSQWAFTASEGACQGLPSCPSFTVGMNHLDGAHALAFSRERHNVPGGDRGRGTDQQAVITAILNKAVQPSSLFNYSGIVSAISGSIQTSMTPDQISAQIRQQISDGTKWKVTSMSVTGADDSQYTCSYPHQKLYVMDPDQASVDKAKQAIQDTLNGK